MKGIPFDTPVLGYATGNANFLRLWRAAAEQEFDLDAFQAGEYFDAVDAKIRSENITKILYPNDENPAGKQLRLEQQYFLVSCALQDCIRLMLQRTTIDAFPDQYAVQLNDTHPALAVAELMRLFVDVHGIDWDTAWAMTRRSLSYTNHTLLPEALETWTVPLFSSLLPRHFEIVLEINRRFLDEVRARFPGDDDLVARMSLIDERGERSVRMAHLATVGGHAVNGVAALHSRLLRETVLRDFAEMTPERFTNVTNGVTPRRFIALSNPGLTRLITDAIGDGWLTDLERLRELAPFAKDASFRERFRQVKFANKEGFARWLAATQGIEIDPRTLFDVQCKRIHEYKRQHLNLLHVAWLYDRILRGERDDIVPRTFLIAGKAAPAYRMAKLIIRLATAIGETIARDPLARELLRVVFVPDFNVKNAQRIYPAADLSEQISTAGKEASGTGNMKLAMNGALTIGTLDGANVEIRDAVGPGDFFLFGMTAEAVTETLSRGYDPRSVRARDPELAAILDQIRSGRFSPQQPDLFEPLVRSLEESDPFLVLAEFRSYADCQRQVAQRWNDIDSWTRAAIQNVASMGRFSSDRAIRDYAREIWKLEPVAVKTPAGSGRS